MIVFHNIHFRQYRAFLLLLTVASLLRLLFIGVFPPGAENVVLLRLPTSVASLVSIVLLMVLVFKNTHNKKLTFWSGFWLAIMPWHLEQSRVYSEIMFGLVVLLGAGILWQIGKCIKCKVVIIAAAGIILWRVTPSIWIFHPPYNLPSIIYYVSNLFKLLSVEFLFFKNETFWLGGFRTIGVLLPSTIYIFLIGLFQLAKKTNTKIFPYFAFVSIWLLSAANPTFPEGREFFLIVPFLSIVLGYGTIKSIELYQKSSLIIKSILLLFFSFTVYEYIYFFHYYIVHYSQRIENEISNEQKAF